MAFRRLSIILFILYILYILFELPAVEYCQCPSPIPQSTNIPNGS